MSLVAQLLAQIAQATAHPLLFPQGVTPRLSFSQRPQGTLDGRVLLLNTRATTPSQTHSVHRATLQGSVQFAAALANGLHIHARDLRQETVSPMTYPLGLQGNIPTPLLLIQSAQQQVHSPMQFSL